MDFESLKVGNFLLNREDKRTRARVCEKQDVTTYREHNKLFHKEIEQCFTVKASINQDFFQKLNLLRRTFTM